MFVCILCVKGRACWSLGNVNLALGNHENALYFASKHLEISKEVNINNLKLFLFSFTFISYFSGIGLLLNSCSIPNF